MIFGRREPWSYSIIGFRQLLPAFHSFVLASCNRRPSGGKWAMSLPARKKRITRSLAELVPAAMGDALSAQGFANGEILLRWGEIAGEPLASRSEPVRMAWPRGNKEQGRNGPPATLHVQVEGAFALDLQMQTPVMIERINRYFGWQCVGAIKIKQGPVRKRKPKAPSAPVVLSPADEEKIARLAAGAEDERLADALQRLGRAVTAAHRR